MNNSLNPVSTCLKVIDTRRRLSQNGATVEYRYARPARNLPAARSKGAVMYFWKCWRETRVSFYVFLFIAVTLSALLWKIMDFTMSELPPKQLFALAWVILLFASSALLGLAAITFGAVGISEEFAHKTAVFLLTKPRSIRYFVWTAWAANALQFLTLTVSMMLVGASILSWRYHAPLTGRLLLAFVPWLIVTFLIFGMTYLLAEYQKGHNEPRHECQQQTPCKRRMV